MFSALTLAMILLPFVANASDRAPSATIHSIRTQDRITEVRLKGEGAKAAAERLQLIGGGYFKRSWIAGTYSIRLPGPTMLGPSEKMIRAAVDGHVPRHLLEASRLLKQQRVVPVTTPAASAKPSAGEPARTMAGTFDPSHVPSVTDVLKLY